MDKEVIASIERGETTLGIELGSTRIKAILIGKEYNVLAAGGFEWENKLIDGVWTYALDDVWSGLQSCYRDLVDAVKDTYGITLKMVGAMGVSAMMHGYLPFDEDGEQLTAFRTWRNTMTGAAADELSDLFSFNIPQRWSIAHIYQAIKNKEEHIGDVRYITTLAGYVHWRLTGKNVLGVGEASGMFPIDSSTRDFNQKMIGQFDELVAGSDLKHGMRDILPRVLNAGDSAGKLTEEGAKLLDPSGALQSGIPFCPPEGDAGTGMVATNSIAEQTGNVSAGTSIFAMLVLKEELSKMHKEINMLTTPVGRPMAMVHCNNFTSDLDAWIRLFREVIELFGGEVKPSDLYGELFREALKGEAAGGDLLAYIYYGGEAITKLQEGRPLFTRLPDSRFSLADFMRTLIFSSMATLKIGMDILLVEENVQLDYILGHGGFFKTEGVGQNLLASALNVPVVVMDTASEGGAWGIALLASYMLQREEDETLEDFLEFKVFKNHPSKRVEPDAKDVQGFEQFIERFQEGLPIEEAAIEHLN